MAKKNKTLADALDALSRIQDRRETVVRSGELEAHHVRALLSGGYLAPIIKGWYHISEPAAREGDTTSWTISFWSFIHRYCEGRFGTDWVLSPEASIALHAGIDVAPKQILVSSTGGGNNSLVLPAGRSLYDLKVRALPEEDRRMVLPSGLRVLTPEAALIELSENAYVAQREAVAAVLAGFRVIDPVTRMVLQGSHKRPGGRIVGALRHLKMDVQADRLASAMRRAEIDLREENPFAGPSLPLIAGASPISNLIRSFWRRDRDKIEALIALPPGLRSARLVLAEIDDVYTHDAWNSLSIEGYRVSRDLIEKIRRGDWRPEDDPEDKEHQNAMAAKGYWNVFQSVRHAVESSIGSATTTSPRGLLEEWYADLFQPSLEAGILTPVQLVGYRNHPVYIRTANHVPPAAEKLMDAMETWFDLVDGEKHPGVAAVLAHWLLGYIHPFPDGNGRLARFVMNSILASSGYPWVVIRLEERARYMRTLDAASFGGDITPFAELIRDHIAAGLAARYGAQNPSSS